MLRTLCNEAKMGNTESDLITDALETLRKRLPNGWEVQLEATRLPVTRDYRFDAVASITAPDRRQTTIAIEAKTRIAPRDALFLSSMAARLEGTPLIVVSPFLSRATRERLREADLNWLDLTGNLRLVLSQPGLFIETQGDQRRRGSAKRPARTLKGQTAGRAVRALLSASLPIGVRELAQRARTDPGYMSRVLELLDTGALIEREPRGPVTQVDRARLIRRWAEDAPIETRGKTETYLEPRGLKALLGKLQNTQLSYAITGSLAAQRWAPVAASRLGQLYVASLYEAATELGLRPAKDGANVQVIRPKDLDIIERAERADDGLIYASPTQVVVDLLTSPGRSPSEGEALLEWMIGQDNVWR